MWRLQRAFHRGPRQHFIADLQRQSQWTSWAAAAGIAVGLQALEKYLK
jgi:hypothetical protein